MSSTRTTVDKISCDAEIEPSVVRVEGTVDSSLNEAPRYQVLCGHHYEYARDGVELDSIVESQLRRGVVAEVVVWLPDRWLRDGQPGLPQS